MSGELNDPERLSLCVSSGRNFLIVRRIACFEISLGYSSLRRLSCATLLKIIRSFCRILSFAIQERP